MPTAGLHKRTGRPAGRWSTMLFFLFLLSFPTLGTGQRAGLAVGSQLLLVQRVSRPVLRTGEMTTITLTVTNWTGEDWISSSEWTSSQTLAGSARKGGLFIRGILPTGFKYAARTTRAELLRPGETSGRVLTLADPTGPTLLRFASYRKSQSQSFTLLQGETLRISYQITAGLEVKPAATYYSGAQLLGEGDIALGTIDEQPIRVEADELVDRGILLGQLFCDSNGDGWRQEDEEGVAGARVYADTGVFVASDPQGLFSLAAIPPGNHLFKVDPATLPAGTSLIGPPTRLAHFTAGLAHKLSWPLHCSPEEQEMGVVEVNSRRQALEAQQLLRGLVEVRGAVAPGQLWVEGQEVALPSAQLVLERDPTDQVVQGVVRRSTADGEGRGTWRWLLRSAGPPPQSWRLSITPSPGSMPVRVFQGAGAPPARLTWDGTGEDGRGQALRAGQLYLARLELQSAGATFAASAPVFCGVDLPHQVKPVFEELLRDELFLPDRADPAPLLLQRLQVLAARLAAPGLRITVEVHDDDVGDPQQKMQLSQARAQRLKDLLVERFKVGRDRIEATGFGGAQPIAPNLGERNRWKNRRVLLRADQLDGPAAASTGSGPRLHISGHPMPLRPDGTFNLYAPRPTNQRLLVELQGQEGQLSGGWIPLSSYQELPVPSPLPVWLQVEADADSRNIRVQGRSFSMSLLDVDLQPAGEGAMPGFRLRGPAPTIGWRLVIRGLEREPVHTEDGRGPPPEFYRWPGAADGQPRTPERMCAQLMVWDRTGSFAFSPSRCFQRLPASRAVQERGFAPDPAAAIPADTLQVRVNGQQLATPEPRRASGRVAVLTPGTMLIEVTDPQGRRGLLRIGLPRLEAAEPAPAELVLPPLPPARLPAERSEATTPTDAPALPTPGGPGPEADPDQAAPDQPPDGASPELPVEPAPVAAPPMPTVGTTSPVPPQPAEIQPVPPQPAEIPAEAPSEFQAPTLTPWPAPPGSPPETGQPAPLPLSPGSPLLPPAPTAPPAPSPPPAPTAPSAPSPPPPAAWPPEAPEAPSGSLLPEERTRGTGGDAAWPAPEEQQPSDRRNVSFGAAELELALRPRGLAPTPTAALDQPARQLHVALPRRGHILPQPRLRLRGSTHPDNQLTINGQPVSLEGGQFDTWVNLPAGKSTLLLRTLDREGNEGLIRWPVEVARTQHFLLALADGTVGDLRAQLREQQTEPLLTGERLYATGRAALYYKGRISGSRLFEHMFVTAHLDTAKQRDFTPFFRQVIDPSRSYAVYGDASEEVAEAASRGPLYLLVEADESQLRIGSFRTEVEGIELVRFDRVLQGEQLRLRKEWRPGWRTHLNLFHASADNELRHGHDELAGTGSSLYYTSRRPILEGSEQLRVVVRDRISNLILSERPLRPEVDYEIRYEAGRVLLKRPLASTADAGWLPGPPDRSWSSLGGHRLFLVADYEYRDPGSFEEDTKGFDFSQELGGIIRVGASGVTDAAATTLSSESSSDPYQLLGANLSLTPWQGVRLDLELARSQGSTGTQGQSMTGGITYGPTSSAAGLGVLGGWQPAPAAAGDSLGALGALSTESIQGDARLGRLRADLGLLFDRALYLPALELHYQQVDQGFRAHGTLLDQGTSTYGFQLSQPLGPADRLLLLHEGSNQELFGGEALQEAEDHRTTVQYRHQQQNWTALIQYDLLRSNRGPDEIEPTLTNTNGITGGLTRRITDRLDLFVQQAVLQGGNAAAYASDMEKISTSGGLSYRLLEDLRIDATERIHWSGATATMVGFTTRLEDGTDLYLQQRLGGLSSLDGYGSALVFGAQQTAPGASGLRSFSEVQLEDGSGFSTTRSRALVGLGRRWAATPWLALEMAFEHSQVHDLRTGPLQTDALAAGGDLVFSPRLRGSIRWEVRFQEQDPDRGGRDLRQLIGLHRFQTRLGRDTTLHGRVDLSETRDQAQDALEARTLEAVVGIAYRPASEDWFHVLAQYGHLLERSPGGLLPNQVEEYDADVFSIVPVFDTPWRIQLVEKVVWRHARERALTLPEEAADLLLWINRINWRFLGDFELGGEWRYLRNFRSHEQEHGLVGELAYVVANHVRLAAGYNFTSISDNEFQLRSHEEGGPFFRLAGQY